MEAVSKRTSDWRSENISQKTTQKTSVMCRNKISYRTGLSAIALG